MGSVLATNCLRVCVSVWLCAGGRRLPGRNTGCDWFPVIGEGEAVVLAYYDCDGRAYHLHCQYGEIIQFLNPDSFAVMFIKLEAQQQNKKPITFLNEHFS